MEQIGKYRVIRVIGEGGMGRVYEASDPMINRRVAIKTISQPVLRNPETRARFVREAQAAGQLSHPNLITIHDIAEDDGMPFIVMEYLEGEELTDTIAKGRLSLDVKLRVMIDVCQGMAYAHKKGLVHRDIKPANIFITAQYHVKILDFGLARGLESDITRTGNVVGTPSYMAPEQIRGEQIDQRADIFAAGVVLYELLSGRKPFAGDSTAATIYQVLEHQPEPVDRLDPNLPGDLAKVVERALAKDPAARYQRIDEMGSDLMRIKAGADSTLILGTPAPAPVPMERHQVTSSPGEVRPRPPASRHWVVAGALVVAAAVAFFVANRFVERPAPIVSPETPTAVSPRNAAPPPSPSETPAANTAARPADPSSGAQAAFSAPPPSRDAARPLSDQRTPRPEAQADVTRANVPPQTATPARTAEPAALPVQDTPRAPEPAPVSQAPAPTPVPAPVVAAQPAAAPTPPAPPAAPPPPPVENSAAAVNELLMRYKSALEARDLAALKQIWPGLSGRQEAAIKAEFDNARAIAVTLQAITPSITSNKATVTCRRDYVVTTQDRKTLTTATRMTMTLDHKNGAWLIDSIRHDAER